MSDKAFTFYFGNIFEDPKDYESLDFLLSKLAQYGTLDIDNEKLLEEWKRFWSNQNEFDLANDATYATDSGIVKFACYLSKLDV
jgi:hypothetical protein